MCRAIHPPPPRNSAFLSPFEHCLLPPRVYESIFILTARPVEPLTSGRVNFFVPWGVVRSADRVGSTWGLRDPPLFSVWWSELAAPPCLQNLVGAAGVNQVAKRSPFVSASPWYPPMLSL